MNTKIFLSLLVILSALSAWADGTIPEGVVPPPGLQGGRPKAPSNVYLYCTIDNGEITFTSNVEINSMNVEISGANFATLYYYNVELGDAVAVPEADSYSIVCTTDDGRVFAGTIYAN